MDRPLTFRRLKAILARYGVSCDPSRGKGSHALFYMEKDGATISFPVPTSRNELPRSYARSCRKAFGLTEADGTSDEAFYG